MIPYGRQFIDENDIQAVIQVLKSEYLTTGPIISEFEKQFAQKVGAKYAVAVCNGTAALHVACLAAGLTKEDEIITTPMTFAASANCALYCAAKPCFCDIHLENGLINETNLDSHKTINTKILIPVHYSGMICHMEEISDFCKKNNLICIEDACHALGSTYKNSIIGDCTYSDMTIFSFHPVKHITTGEGGMITTNSKDLYEKLLVYRTHGITKDSSKMNKNDGPWFYEMQYLGYNYRMTDIQAALGISQLNKLDDFVKRRREIAQKYDLAFNKNEFFSFLKSESNSVSSYHLYPILLKEELEPNKKEIFEELRKRELWVQVHYIPVYQHPFYKNLGYKDGSCPKAEKFYLKEISLPMYPAMSDEDVNMVIKVVLEVMNLFKSSIKLN